MPVTHKFIQIIAEVHLLTLMNDSKNKLILNKIQKISLADFWQTRMCGYTNECG